MSYLSLNFSRIKELLCKKRPFSQEFLAGNLQLGFHSSDVGIANKFAWKAILNIAREEGIALYMITSDEGCFLIISGLSGEARELNLNFDNASLFIRAEEEKIQRISKLIPFFEKAKTVYFSGGESSKGIFFFIRFKNPSPILIDTDSIEAVDIGRDSFCLEIRIPSSRHFSKKELEFLINLTKRYQLNLRIWKDFWSDTFTVEFFDEGLTRSFRTPELKESLFWEKWYKEELLEVLRNRNFLEKSPEAFWEALSELLKPESIS